MARQERMDTTDDIVRLPKDLKARHDQLVERINARRDKERMIKEKEKYVRLNAQIEKRLPEVRRYFWEDDTYMNAMAEGRSWILFLRRKSEMDKPYYTIEINMYTDKILQYYSEYDRQPNKEEIRKVLDKFKQSLKKTRIRVPA